MTTVYIVATCYFPSGPTGDSRRKSYAVASASWRKYLTNSGGVEIIQIDSATHGRGVGHSLNIGFSAAFMHDGLALYAADDWALTAPLDLTPWVELLETEPSIGMVRLGPPHPDLTGKVRLYPQGWALLLDRHHFAFGHRPALYHRRMIDSYGLFAEGINAFECERLYNETFCHMLTDKYHVPDIAYALPHPWQHVGETEVGDLEP